jgi:hypothetical protein
MGGKTGNIFNLAFYIEHTMNKLRAGEMFCFCFFVERGGEVIMN